MENDIKLYNGDCLDIILTLSNIDCVLADPPYGTTHLKWDNIINFNLLWENLYNITNDTTPFLIFGIEPFSSMLRLSNINDYKYDFYWKKERITNIAQVKKRAGKIIETISVFYRKQPVYNPQMVKYNGPKRSNKVKNGKLGDLVNKNGKNKVKEYNDTGYRYPTQLLEYKRDILTSNLHPTQKPIKLLEFLIKSYSNEGDTILDFCMGSGSTGIAAINTNRKFIGIEKNKNIFKTAEKRITNHFFERSFFS